jgi:hypothetical protein
MSGKFNMDDYVDVAARIAQFAEKYPNGSLQADLEPLRNVDGELVGWLCKAYAYRDNTDERPGIGHAVEPVPGKTSYTKDSEAMNAETSAWGRAIIALGFQTKKIASANEARNRQEGPKSNAPKSWAAVTEITAAYDQTTHDTFAKFIDSARRLLYPQSTSVKELPKADRDFMFQKVAGAAVHLRDQFDPGAFPPPSVDDVRACFARVLDGQELALEGES